MDWLEDALAKSPTGERLARQLRFIIELDKAKSVYRQSYLTDGSRKENDAEHMWHVMMAGLLLAEHANEEGVDPVRLALMLSVHDIVEIDAGDVFIYDEDARIAQAEREQKAADRIFAILPDDQRDELRSLWEEFEAKKTPTAKMAAAIDRLLPLMMNRALDGRSWREHGISARRVIAMNSQIAGGSEPIWDFARTVLEAAAASGILGSD